MKTYFEESGAENRIVYKDKYYVNYFVGDNEVDVSLLDNEVKVNGNVMLGSKEFVNACYRHAGYNGRYDKISNEFAEFLLACGTISWIGKSSRLDTLNKQLRNMIGTFNK